MTIQDQHAALVASHHEIEAILKTVLRRGARRHRQRKRLARVAIVTAIVGALGIGIYSTASTQQTRVTGVPRTFEPLAPASSTDVANPVAMRTIRLQASDSQTSSTNGTPSRAAGARYTATAASGALLAAGTIDESGEASFTVRSSTVTISVDRCGFKGSVDPPIEPGATRIVGFPCGGSGSELPPRSIPKTDRNPTDDELRAAHHEVARCIEAAGLTVSHESLTIDESGVVRSGLQVGLGDSGLNFEEADAIQTECDEYYMSLLGGRIDWLKDQEG